MTIYYCWTCSEGSEYFKAPPAKCPKCKGVLVKEGQTQTQLTLYDFEGVTL